MKYFQALGRTIEKQWRARNYSDAAFPKLAKDALLEDPAHRKTSPRDIFTWLHGQTELPAQFAPRSTFGQPPVTVYRGARFMIEVLFWFDGTTTIHSHAFTGAFQVFAGSSVHGVYEFTQDEVFSSWFRSGHVRLDRMELLRVGDTRGIDAGRSFIHALFHLDRPSVSIVVRTMQDRSVGSQYHYEKPYFEIASFARDQQSDLRLRSMRALRDIDARAFWKSLQSQVSSLDIHTAYELVRLVGYGEPDRLEPVLSAARRRHGEIVDRFVPVLIEQHRQSKIIERRQHVHDAEHRFFLALLLNAPTRTVVLDLVRQRFPKADAIDTILRWIRELAELPSPLGQKEPNALGLPMGAGGLFVLRHALKGSSASDVIRAMQREFDPADVRKQRGDIEALHKAFPEYPLFRTLFVPDELVRRKGRAD